MQCCGPSPGWWAGEAAAWGQLATHLQLLAQAEARLDLRKAKAKAKAKAPLEQWQRLLLRLPWRNLRSMQPVTLSRWNFYWTVRRGYLTPCWHRSWT